VLKLCTSNRLEVLADALADALGARASPLEVGHVVVPNRPLERFVELALARRLGIASGLRFERLEVVLARLLGAHAGAPLLSRGEVQARLLEILGRPAALSGAELAPVVRWLDAGGPTIEARERRIVSLSDKLAGLFSEYDATRPELVRRWLAGGAGGATGGLAGWQAALLRAVRALGAAEPLAAGEPVTMAEALELLGSGEAPGLPSSPLHVLGVSSATRAEHLALAALARTTDVHVYALDPCREFWEDAEAPRAVARRLLRAPDADVEAALGGPATESGLLGAWGRPAREHLVVLRDLAGYAADERWAAPERSAAATTLEALQRSLLDRAPVAAREPDQSVRFLGCPSVRREVETVAREIWAAIAEADAAGSTLSFSDVAVLLHDEARARYLPHVEAVCAEARGIPWSSRDLLFAGSSAVA